MTLDASHVGAIRSLFESVDRTDRTQERHDLAEKIWQRAFCDSGSGAPVEPIGEPMRHQAPLESLALVDNPFSTVAAVDAGSLNPTVYQNGLVVDLAHAAVATTPSDIDRHRERTIVAVVHGPPSEIRSTDWTFFDGGYSRSRLIAAPTLDREEDTLVHTLALESAEINHALDATNTDDDLLILDGSVYPASLLHWESREGALRSSLFEEPEPRGVLCNAASLVDGRLAAGRPTVGIVKNWTARGFVRALAESDLLGGAPLPWPTDYALFQQLLATDSTPSTLHWTSWFTMGFGVGASMPGAIDRLDLDLSVDAAEFQLAFMAVYYPRENVVFRVEAPVGAIRDPDDRAAITEYVLAEMAAEGGPPAPVRKADTLARIGRHERRMLREELATVLDTVPLRRFDDIRWADVGIDQPT